MSGIAAIFNRNGRPAERRAIERMARALAMYGPDRQKVVLCGPVALAYTHFANVPESKFEAQPLSGAGGRFALVFDGRLDNREDLAESLGLDAAGLRTMADGTLAMRTWEQWQERAPERWIGEFAAIVWDEAQQVLFAVRDHFARRALSYHDRKDRLVVASAPKGIFALGDIDRAVDEQRLADVLGDFYHDGSRSFYKGISRIEPAQILRVGRHTTSATRYWSPDLAREIVLPTDDDYLKGTRERFDCAVKAHMRSHGPVGASLSGGLDSSAVAVTALPHLDGQRALPVFTCVPEDGWDGPVPDQKYGDETPFVEAIADMHPRLDLVRLSSPGRRFDHRMEDLFLAAESITRSPLVSFCGHDVHEAARARGVKALLEGNGGNMSLSWNGRGLYLNLLRERQWVRLLRELSCVSDNPYQFARRTASRVVLPMSPKWLWEVYARSTGLRARGPRWRQYSAIHPDFANDLRIEERAATFGFTFYGKPDSDTRALRAEVLTSDCAMEFGDIFQGYRALYGIELRHPLTDLRLVEWCLGLPDAQYLRQGQSRWLVRRLMRGRLPDCVLDNPKRGLMVADWHRRMTCDVPRIERELDTLASDPDTASMIDVGRLKRAVKAWPSITPTHFNSDKGLFLRRALPHAIAVGRFVRWVKGANQ